MDTTHARPIPGKLLAAFMLAQLLQRMDNSGQAADPGQFQAVAQRLSDELDQVQDHETLPALLDAFPAAATVYENRRYVHAGLCRQPLQRAMDSELLAKDVIARARRVGA